MGTALETPHGYTRDEESGTLYTNLWEVMDRTGDTRILWDKNNPDDVAAAKAQFNSLVNERKMTAFLAVGEKGEKGKRITTFDPNAERLIFVSQYQGG